MRSNGHFRNGGARKSIRYFRPGDALREQGEGKKYGRRNRNPHWVSDFLLWEKKTRCGPSGLLEVLGRRSPALELGFLPVYFGGGRLGGSLPVALQLAIAWRISSFSAARLAPSDCTLARSVFSCSFSA